jgi:hypothetical protein
LQIRAPLAQPRKRLAVFEDRQLEVEQNEVDCPAFHSMVDSRIAMISYYHRASQTA